MYRCRRRFEAPPDARYDTKKRARAALADTILLALDKEQHAAMLAAQVCVCALFYSQAVPPGAPPHTLSSLARPSYRVRAYSLVSFVGWVGRRRAPPLVVPPRGGT